MSVKKAKDSWVICARQETYRPDGTTRLYLTLISFLLAFWLTLGCGNGMHRPGSVGPPIPFQATTSDKNLIVSIGTQNTDMEFVLIPAGRFIMGSTAPDWSQPDQGPQRAVVVKEEFYMLKTEVTQRQWNVALPDSRPWEEACIEFLGYMNLPGGESVHRHFLKESFGGDFPVFGISWEDCQEYIRRLNRMVCSSSREASPVFRLPSEAEWEYACRAGTRTSFYFGDLPSSAKAAAPSPLDQYAISFYSAAIKGPGRVRQRIANPWGLFDMHGNVLEACQDSYHENYDRAPSDTTPWISNSSSLRVFRGGGWLSSALNCTSASRVGLDKRQRDPAAGFRLVIDSSAATRLLIGGGPNSQSE